MRHRRPGLTLIELLVAVALVAILVGLTLGGIQRIRAAAARADCQNRLRQIAISLQNYQGTHSFYPPGVSPAGGGADAMPHVTWLTRLLPFMEQSELWVRSVQAYQADKFFESDPHLPLLGRKLVAYTCPADPSASGLWSSGKLTAAFTSYLGVEGYDLNSRDGVLYLDSKVSARDISDGTSSTLAVGERPPSPDGNLGWWYAGWGQSKTGSADSVLGTRERRVEPRYSACPSGPYIYQNGRPDDNCAAFHFWSIHSGGANFAFCDGSVRFLSYSADGILPSLATRAGGEVAQVPN